MRAASARRPCARVPSLSPVRRSCLAFLCVLAAATAARTTDAGAVPPQDSTTPPGTAYTVRDAVQQARRNNPLARAEDLQVRATEEQVRYLRSQRWIPQIRLEGATGLVPEARGDVFYSPNSADSLAGLGPFFQARLSVVEPLTTFGKFRYGLEAARSGLNARSSQRDHVRNEVTLEALRSYWGLVASRRAVDVAEEMRERYDELLEDARAYLEDESSEVDDTDVYEIESFGFDVESFHQDASARTILAREAFNLLVGRPVDAEVLTSDEETPQVLLGADAAPALVTVAERVHPQLRALTSAVSALEARVLAQGREKLPNVFLAGGLGFAHSSNRDDQDNPFVYDEFNYLRAGLYVGVRWDLGFVRHGIEKARLQIEREATDARRAALRGKVELDVRKALRDVLRNGELLTSARGSRRAARSWLRLAFDNWDLGIGEAERLLKAYTAYYRLQGSVIERQYELNLSLAQLAFALGDLDRYLDWIDRGQVTLD